MPQPDHFRVGFLERPKPDEFSRTLVRRGARQQGLLAWTTERGNQLVGCKMLDKFNIDANWQLLRNCDDCNLVSVRYAEVHIWLTLADNRLAITGYENAPVLGRQASVYSMRKTNPQKILPAIAQLRTGDDLI